MLNQNRADFGIVKESRFQRFGITRKFFLPAHLPNVIQRHMTVQTITQSEVVMVALANSVRHSIERHVP
jgi:hypothetical protein